MKNKTLLLIVSLLIPCIILSQSNFLPGFVVTKTGDTLFGEICYRSDLLMSKECSFRKEETAPKIIYTPDDISVYRFIKGSYYVSQKINGKQVFLEFLFDGKVDIYFMRDDNGKHYFIDKEGLGMNELPYSEEIRYDSRAGHYGYKSSAHIGILILYMQDVPSLKPPDGLSF